MTIPNILTIYFQEKHQKFPIGFEQFGTDIARIGTGDKGKGKAGVPHGSPADFKC